MKTKQKIFDLAIFSSIVAAGILLIPEPSNSNLKSDKPEILYSADKDTQHVEKNEKLRERDMTQFLSRF